MIKKEFDWQTLPEIKYLGFLIKFDDDVEAFFERNKDLTEVYERARASRMFFAQGAKETEPWRIGAYLTQIRGFSLFYGQKLALFEICI